MNKIGQNQMGQDEITSLARGLRQWAFMAVCAAVAIAGAGESRAAAKIEASPASLRLAIEDLAKSFPGQYTRAGDYLNRLEKLEKDAPGATADAKAKWTADFTALQREALLGNPLLNFDKLLLVKRDVKRKNLGLPQNWQGNCALPATGYENEIVVLSPVRPEGELTSLFKPEGGRFVGDVDLDFKGDRMMFSMPNKKNRWAIWQIKADGSDLLQISPSNEPDVDWYDPCYLPDGRILFDGTACFAGVPCVGGGNQVANMYQLDPVTGKLRQLTFDQEHNWCPTVLNNGRVLYSRWEYTDSPHYFTRLLFHMNPDGTEQMEFYGSNSYWPNSIFYARPIPGHATKVVAVISGHHGVPRMGELVVFDPSKARHEAGGAVQRIPGYNKPVDPIIGDSIVDSSWPKFLHPFPLNDKYFLVSGKPSEQADWGIYLVDIFDNMVLLKGTPDFALFEPVPMRKTETPPIVPDKVDLAKSEATVYLQNIYAGSGLVGVPKGAVKKLRLIEYHYAYPQMGGHINIGIDGPWDVHRIIGTVPVNADGSASFKVPANRPLAVQPLDAEGKALQVMRSWFTAMPGENISCVGCHEPQNSVVTSQPSLAFSKAPAEIEPWYGPARGFSFPREVQPVLDKNCTGCHDGKARTDGKNVPNFADITKGDRGFTKSYLALHPYVRRPGPESDYHVQKPGEWHVDTSELVQMLKKGHYGVKLDVESWDRLITWIDMNVPDHGTWGDHRKVPSNFRERRMESLARYSGRTNDPEAYPTAMPARVAFVKPDFTAPEQKHITAPGWPLNADDAKKAQAAVHAPIQLSIPLTNKVSLDLTLIPAGEFVMGDADGSADESPETVVRIDKPFYIGTLEVLNEQYAQYDTAHDSAYISVFNKDQSNRGESARNPRQPAIRVSWSQAMGYCRWLSEKTGRKFSLPTEAQWEYACRAGASTPMSYGACDADFAKLGNFADQQVYVLCRADSPHWIPAIAAVNDGAAVTAQGGRYAPNAWGVKDMHGNAAEWTLTTYKPYPYAEDGRNNASADGRKVVRGGSFYDRPQRARSAFRLSYPAWQCVFNVGFRVVCEVGPEKTAMMGK